MILTCPSCATSYFTPDEAIGPAGRTVRCKSCQHTWRATLDEPLELGAEAPPEPASFARRDEPAETLAETPAPELPKAFRARAEQQRRLRRAAAHGAVWAGIASGFAVLLGSAWLFRVDVVETFPKAAAAYAAVGSPVNPTGLDFEAIRASPSPSDPGRVLVSGALRNVRDNEVVAPPVRVALLDAHGAEIGHAVVRIDAAPVLPGKVQGFAALIADPGGKGQGVGVDFTTLEAAAPLRPARVAPRPRPLPEADHPTRRVDEPGALRPALAPGPTSPTDLQPIDARPIEEAEALDSYGAEAVSASHG